MNYNERIKQIVAQRRHRTIMWCRLRYGVAEVFRHPWKLVFPLLLFTLSGLAYHYRSVVRLPSGTSFHGLEMLWEYTVILLIVTLTALAFLGLVIGLGTPRHAKQIEASLTQIKLVDRYGFAPVLVSVKPKQSPAEEQIFYSKGISKEMWITQQPDVEDVLDCHLLEDIQYGGRDGTNRNYIVLITAPGAEQSRKDVLYDDKL